MRRETIFSPCRHYRYVLWREWKATNMEYAMFIGLNPSTADEIRDDPTIRRCAGYARRWGYGALCMTNLFAYRATKPALLKAHARPIGADNDIWLAQLAESAALIVAAWGIHGAHLHRDQAVMRLLKGKLTCLRKTKDGHPWHPLYLKRTARPSRFQTSNAD
jgi:hypothetical protein